MNCKEAIPEIVETVRARRDLKGMLRAHISSCAACAERWEAECELASHFRLIRVAASARRSSSESRNDLMRQFSARHWRLIHPAWGVGLAAAAALLIVFATMRGPFEFGRRGHHAPPAMGAWLSSSAWSVELAADADAMQEEGYVPVPYAPPLATGERLSVMHAELYPAALTTLGVSIDPAEMAMTGNTTVRADVVVGQDGLPRAVRLDRGEQPDSAEYESGESR